MKKRKIVLIASASVLVFALLFLPFWARHRALEYLEETYNKYVVYGEVIRLEDLKFGKTRVNIFTGDYSVQAVYDNVMFEVYGGGDTYAERYLGWRYAGVMRSDGMDELVDVDGGVVIMERVFGPAALDRTDVKFQMFLSFRIAFETKEEYAAAVRQVLNRLKETELTGCDALRTYGYVSDRFMECSLSPMWEDPTDAELLDAVTVSKLGG